MGIHVRTYQHPIMNFILTVLITLPFFRYFDGSPVGSKLIDNLMGQWEEDANSRTNTDEFLAKIGVGDLDRQLVSILEWEDQQTFKPAGLNLFGINVHMLNGPEKTEISGILIPDGKTMTKVDVGKHLGGMMETTTKVQEKEHQLVTIARKEGQNNVWLLLTREINPKTPNKMTMTTVHGPSGVETSSIFYKK